MKDLLIGDFKTGCEFFEDLNEMCEKYYPFKGDPFLFPYIGSIYTKRDLKPICEVGKVEGAYISVYICDDGTNREIKDSVIDKLKALRYTIMSDSQGTYAIYDYNGQSTFIGKVENVWFKYCKYGIVGKDIEPIGKSETDGKWYGWSHRAICGFGIGDMIFDEKYIPEDGTKISTMPFVLRGSKVITNDEEAKLAALNFANYVS